MRSQESINGHGRIVKQETVTKHDTNYNRYDSIYANAGDIAIVCKDDDTDAGVVYTLAAAGFLPFATRKILSTGTTCTQIIGLIIE